MKGKFRYIGLCSMVSALLFLAACVEEFEANVGGDQIGSLVVEGNIISDSTVVFSLSKTLPLVSSEEDQDLFASYLQVDADVSVVGSDGTVWEGWYMGQGQYHVAIGTLQPDVEYSLRIEYDGATYTSDPQVPQENSGIEDLDFVQPDLLGPVSIRVSTSEQDLSGQKFYLWDYEEDWEVRSEFVSTSLYDPTDNRIVYYDYPPVAQGWSYERASEVIVASTESQTENRIINKVIHTIDADSYRLSCLYSIRVTQRNLSRQEYEYYQVRVTQSSEMGGLFTPQPSELPTNITCSDPNRVVIGYVGCNMGVSYRQIYIPTREVSFVNHYDCEGGKVTIGSAEEMYINGYQVTEVAGSDVFWARIRCVDVQKKGADPFGRPSWWPNPYIYYKEPQDDSIMDGVN